MGKGVGLKLHEYLENCRNSPFVWGVNDCFRFVNGWLVVSGVSPFIRNESLPYNSEKSARRTYFMECRHFGVKNLAGLFDNMYERVNHVPPDGSICARLQQQSSLGFVLGLVDGRSSVFMGMDGLEFLSIDPYVETYWKIK